MRLCSKAFFLVLLLGLSAAGAAWADGMPRANPAVAERVNAISEEDFIVYQDENSLHHVTVFTDVNCPICRRMHNQMEDYQMFDIAIRYAAFPNIGNAMEQMHGVWCSEDRKAAMGQAKRSEEVAVAGCRSEAVDEQMELAISSGLVGTPAIITPQGRLLYGHVPAERLIEVLEWEAAQ